ncbi:MAG TPA: thiamine phosphate synthase [Deltaproteobacteria bacterium]|nr:thiamine phosphate synthase [Deltaproteobacteria bacterium]HPR54079.1 thiamine phosphate synthase [Deltaproteobacteria bacterium]HXK46859.1 thiamine phosphate synthase [Deltaproteobacteria bacterium]
MNGETCRIVDANLNRITEGLRVAEDVCRYAWNIRGVQGRLKSLRHRVAVLLDRGGFIPSRNPMADVGRSSSGALESRRADLAEVVKANLKRVEEGLRVLEEIFKISDLKISAACKNLRYETYEIERKIFAVRERSLGRGLYLILTAPCRGIEDLASAATASGLPAVQLRCKEGDDRYFLDLAGKIRKLTSGSTTRFIINDRMDIACLAGADGVHLGQKDVDPARARTLLGPDAVIGLSTHDLDQVRRANTLPVDYIGFGPIFETASKDNPDPVTGTAALAEAVSLSTVPVVAVGGITGDAIPALKRTGCHDVAVIGAVTRSADPCTETLRLHTLFLEES